jgi:general secretion pathway protein A
MSYYRALGLKKEPFSTSPDPEFFYRSSSHDRALKKLEIAIRLRRGLSVIIGDVGLGKTTLSRMLLQSFRGDDDFVFCAVLDPDFNTEYELLLRLAKSLAIGENFSSPRQLKESLERYLFKAGVEDNKTVVLVIDEGQKLAAENIEVIRTLLNYETNEHKLLQVIILAQVELLAKIKNIHNFTNRISLNYRIGPLDEKETRAMIEFRLAQAGLRGENLFTDGALSLIFQCSRGCPRTITMLCHDALERLIMDDKEIVDEGVINDLIKFSQIKKFSHIGHVENVEMK